jgi:hypothetical protein
MLVVVRFEAFKAVKQCDSVKCVWLMIAEVSEKKITSISLRKLEAASSSETWNQTTRIWLHFA